MTISVTVKVYENADWAAAVIAIDQMAPAKVLRTIMPGQSEEFSATNTRSILVSEISLPKKVPA